MNASIATAEPSRSCHGGCESYDWGDQNDDDYADYYNGTFESFAQVQVTNPDGSTQTDDYGSTNGWGLYSSSITCYLSISCSVAPYNASNGPVFAGQQTEEQDYDSGGHLLKQINWTLASNCPPPGVSGSQNAQGGSSDPGSGQLFSELDRNNPVLVCDPRPTQMDTYTTDGVTSNLNDARVVHETTKYSYDGNGCGDGYDYGNLTAQDETANDVGATHFIAETVFCPNDNLGSGIFLTNLPAKTYMQDQSGNQYGCTQNAYGSNTGDLTPPTVPSLTSTSEHTLYLETTNCTGPGNVSKHSYDAYGNQLTTTDPDNHLGCTLGSSQYSDCATYDGTFETELLTSTNAKNQTTSYGYANTAAGGYGQWLLSETDPNGETTSYQYDALGRLTGVVEPGDSASSPTVTYTYTNTCTSGSTTPCLELDTSVTYTSGGPASTEKQWYDGQGRLVETQAPSPNLNDVIVTYTVYDSMNGSQVVDQTIQSLPYAIATPAGYVAPDLTQARTVTNYDSLGRTIGSVTYDNTGTIVQETSTSYTIATGVPTISSESSNAYEQTITLDAYGHQSITYTDGLGRTRYSQVYSGTASPYNVVRTVGATYDMLGDMVSVTTYDSSGTAQASSNAVYDALKEPLGFDDSDLGSCTDTPMPADCSSTTDTAWKYTYDADGNQLSVTDPRNVSTYTSYDALDRPLCEALTSADASSCGGSTYGVYFYDGYSNASTPGATFPSGCTAPTGSYESNPIGRETAESFVGGSGSGSGWRCYGYDARGETDQSTLSVTTADSQTLTQTVNLTYDDQGDPVSLTYPDGTTLTQQYTTNGYLTSAYFGTPSTPDPVNFLVGGVGYADNGLVSSLAMGGSGPKSSTPTALFTINQGYDGIQRSSSISASEKGTTFYSQTATYDNVGNVLGLATTVPAQGGGTVSENESFCYDALNRLVWAGNSGTPTGGDHCMSAPSSSGITPYLQSYSYDSLDRLTSSAAGTSTYGDPNHPHAVTGLSDMPNQYASYDAMGNMLCRNTDTTSGHTCSGSSPTGATMTYDAQGRLNSWTAPSGTSANEYMLYDNEGNLVLTRTVTPSGNTSTIDFGFTETVLTSSSTTTAKYYFVDGQRLAVQVGSTFSYLIPNLEGSPTVALSSTGSVSAVQLFLPYGASDFAWGTMPTPHNYTDQLLDSQMGLLYYNARYYDPVSDQFLSADHVLGNSSGMNPYGYVQGNPETYSDPTGYAPAGGPWDPEDWYQFLQWIIENVPNGISIANTILMAALLHYNVQAYLQMLKMPNDTIPPSEIESFINGNQNKSSNAVKDIFKFFKRKSGDDDNNGSGNSSGNSSNGSSNRAYDRHKFDKNQVPAGKNGPPHRNVRDYRSGVVVTDIDPAAVLNAITNAVANAINESVEAIAAMERFVAEYERVWAFIQAAAAAAAAPATSGWPDGPGDDGSPGNVGNQCACGGPGDTGGDDNGGDDEWPDIFD